MNWSDLSVEQQNLILHPPLGRIFLEGPPGSGKTTVGVNRLLHLIQQGVPAESILVLAPQRTLAAPYYRALQQPGLPPGGTTSIVTLGGLAQRAIQLFWPVTAQAAGFANPSQPPTFLTLETAQYYMAQIVQPLVEKEGYFESIVIDRNRLYSQILDNLNKAAVVGFPHTEVGKRLIDAGLDQQNQLTAHGQAQDCANRFRAYCLENNLLDYSLQIEVFSRYLWPSFLCREILSRQYRHLIFENIEEDVPITQDIIREWLPDFESALLIYDEGSGYRSFLGADPVYAYSLRDQCDFHASLSGSWIQTRPVADFAAALEHSLRRENDQPVPSLAAQAFRFQTHRFYPDMIEWVSGEVARLVREEGIPPGEIAILSPYLSDSLRFSLINRLGKENIPVRTHRPSRSLRDEPATLCLITLARLAHPQWEFPVDKVDVRSMLMQAIDGLDLVRADLLARILYRQRKKEAHLEPFDPVQPEMQERITYDIGQRYNQLRDWLVNYQSAEPVELDVFLSRLFGEILSQPGFGFHTHFDAAGVTARLVESIQKFRRVAEPFLREKNIPIGKEYLRMVDEGVIAAQYLQTWEESLQEDAVFIAPAFTFLMSNRAAAVQFWLDAGSNGWWQRIYQPLTHPFILSRQWPPHAHWTDENDFQANLETLSRLTQGLLHRCREQVIISIAKVNERGTEERGNLLMAFQSLLRRMRNTEGSSNA